MIDRLAELGFKAHPFDARPRRGGRGRRRSRFLLRCLAVAGFAAMNIMLLSVSVWSGNATDITPEHARLLPLALGADRAAGRRLCRAGRSSIAPSARSWRGAVNMDVPITLGVVLALGMSVVETLAPCRARLFRSAPSCCSSSCWSGAISTRTCAAARATVAGNLAALKAETAVKFVERRRRSARCRSRRSRRATSCWCGRASASRSTAWSRSGRSEIDQSLVTGETAPRSSRRARQVYAGTLNLSGTLTRARRAAASGTLLDEVDAAARPRRRRRARATCASPTAPRGSTRRSSTRPRSRPCSAGSPFGASLARRPHHRDRRADHHLPLRARSRDSGRAGRGRRAPVPRRACCSTPAMRSSAWPRSTRSCSTRPARSPCRSPSWSMRSDPAARAPGARRAARARQPASARGRARPRGAAPSCRSTAPSRSPGSACARCVDGVEMRLGRPSFCGAEREAEALAAGRSRRLASSPSAQGDERSRLRRAPAAARRRGGRRRRAAPARASRSRSCRATAPRRSSMRPRALGVTDWRAGVDAGRQDRPDRGAQARRAARC